MYNLDDILKHCEKSVKSLSSASQQMFIRHQKEIDLVFKILSDDESRYVFGQEISSLMLRSFIQPKHASFLCGFITQDEFQDTFSKAENHCEYNNVLCLDNPIHISIKNYAIATNFVYEQYRYKDFVKIQEGDICIDAGGCLGDSSLYFMRNGANCVYTFEIDKINIECLKATVSKNNYNDKIHVVESAVSSDEGMVFYLPDPANPGGGRIISEQHPGSYAVNVTTIDNFCEKNRIKPSFIKMDIEGSEIDALNGGKNTILSNKPKLAICIYHTIEHRWQIPLLLKEWLPDYKFYIKKSHPYVETVLFGSPV